MRSRGGVQLVMEAHPTLVTSSGRGLRRRGRLSAWRRSERCDAELGSGVGRPLADQRGYAG